MALADLSDWLDEQTAPDRVWFLKRLSANDTGLTGGHQVGIYAPNPLMFDLFPSLHMRNPTDNMKAFFSVYIDSHTQLAEDVRVTWWNKGLRDPNSRKNECHITRLGGTAYQDAESTGALTLLSFVRTEGDCRECHAWVCDNSIEEDLIEERTGPIEPGSFLIWEPTQMRQSDLFEARVYRSSCHLQPDEMPAAWRTAYPTGMEIVAKTVEMRPDGQLPPDKRLLRRRACEYEIFLSIEEAIELPAIRQGFKTIEEFVARAQTLLQRRKSRSGRSLELHARAILLEEGFVEGTDFAWQPKTEQNRTPDFLFPNAQAYHDAAFPASRLRLLAAKTTCKDRWRQVAKEAARIDTKHLLTLQEGVSENQFRQMVEEGVQLVVPQGLIGKYPEPVRPHLVTLESFIGDVRTCLP